MRLNAAATGPSARATALPEHAHHLQRVVGTLKANAAGALRPSGVRSQDNPCRAVPSSTVVLALSTLSPVLPIGLSVFDLIPFVREEDLSDHAPVVRRLPLVPASVMEAFSAIPIFGCVTHGIIVCFACWSLSRTSVVRFPTRGRVAVNNSRCQPFALPPGKKDQKSWNGSDLLGVYLIVRRAEIEARTWPARNGAPTGQRVESPS